MRPARGGMFNNRTAQLVQDAWHSGSLQGGATASVVIKELNIYKLILSGRIALHLHSTCWFLTYKTGGLRLWMTGRSYEILQTPAAPIEHASAGGRQPKAAEVGATGGLGQCLWEVREVWRQHPRGLPGLVHAQAQAQVTRQRHQLLLPGPGPFLQAAPLPLTPSAGAKGF